MTCQQFFQLCVTVMMPVFLISQIMCMRMAVRDRVRITCSSKPLFEELAARKCSSKNLKIILYEISFENWTIIHFMIDTSTPTSAEGKSANTIPGNSIPFK